MADVLKSLFEQANLPYKLLPGVKGEVTLEAKDEALADVLRAVLLQMNGISDEIDGVWVVRPIRSNFILDAKDVPLPRRLPGPIYLDHIEYYQADIQLILKELFQASGLKYRFDPKLKGMVTLDLRRVSFDTVLSLALRQVCGAYRIEFGAYEIVRAKFGSED